MAYSFLSRVLEKILARTLSILTSSSPRQKLSVQTSYEAQNAVSEAQLKPFAEHETVEWIQLLASPEEASFVKGIKETVWCALALAPRKHRTGENVFCQTLPFNTQKGSALLMHHDYVTNYPLDEEFDPQGRIEPEPNS